MVEVVTALPLQDIVPDPENPRKTFDPMALKDLAASIDAHGLLQPISVRPLVGINGHEPRYAIIAGERRWRACSLLKMEKMPAIIRTGLNSDEVASLQIMENSLRSDLNPVEEARALKAMLDKGFSLANVGVAAGMIPSSVKWRVKMLDAREDVLDLLAHGQIAPTVCWAMSSLSYNGQGRALKLMNLKNLSTKDVVQSCKKIYAQENQLEMFAEVKVTEKQRKAVKTFSQAFTDVSDALHRIHALEQDNPGLLAESFRAEAGLIGARVDETIKGLRKIQTVLRDLDLDGIVNGSERDSRRRCSKKD